MQRIETISSLHTEIHKWRLEGHTIGFVPTMGNLHKGHMRLIDEAKTDTSKVVCSIFVNPTQFGPNEDFENYPRTIAADLQLLEQHSIDLLFLPSTEIMYPQGSNTTILISGVSERHCGASRPGHFNGVATIVTKLFNLVQPDIAYFGEKDFQQLTVIRKLAHDLNFPVNIIGVPTVRETDGLAMSSRNSYLTSSERQLAPILFQTLCMARDRILKGFKDFKSLENDCLHTLQQAGFSPDYFSICRVNDLNPAHSEDQNLIILAAAKLGRPRLIDNILVSLN